MEPRNPIFARDYLVVLMQGTDVQSVVKETDRLFDAGHREWWVYHMRGLAKRHDLKNSQALEEFDKAMAAADDARDVDGYQQVLNSVAEISPDEALNRLAPRIATSDRWRLQSVSMRMRKGDWNGAIADLSPMLDRRDKLQRSDRLSAVRFAAECYQASHQAEKSKKFYTEWLAEAPNDPTALNNAAYLLAEDLHDPSGAVQYSQKAYELGRRSSIVDPMILDTHGWVLTLCGGDRADQGLAILSALVDSNGDFLDARYHLAVAYLQKNRSADALRQLNTAMDQIKATEQKNIPVRADLKAQIQTALDKAKQSVAGA